MTRAMQGRGVMKQPKAPMDGTIKPYADLRGAYLVCANLEGADLRGADLKYANLRGANLGGACFVGADLSNTNLEGAILNWQSHPLIAVILLQHNERRLAGLVLVSTDWCWDDFKDNLSKDEWDAGTKILSAWAGFPFSGIEQDAHLQ